MSDVKLNFRVGRSAASTRAPDPAFVAAAVVEKMREAAQKRGIDAVVLALTNHQDEIIAAITADASKFAASAARVFTRIRSPASGAISISLDDVTRGAGVTSTDSLSKRLQGKSTVEWLALTRKTVANKRRKQRARGTRSRGSTAQAETFFVDSGALRDVLLQYLGPAMAALLDPRVTIKRHSRGVTATVSVMSQASGREKAGVTSSSFPGAASPGAISRGESLFTRYLKRVGVRDDPRHPLAYKLENPRGQHRPFLQNMLVFWLSNRLPIVFEKALKSALSKSIKRSK